MTVQLIITGETDIRGQVRDQLPAGYEMGTGPFHAAVDAMIPMPAKWSTRKRSKMAGTSVTKTGDWCKTVLAPLSGLVWSPDALVLPSLEAVWSLVNEAETSIEVTPMIPPTQRSIDSALAAHTEATSGVVRRTRMKSSLAEQATESLRLLNELMRLVDSGSLKASATERAHMVGAMTGLNALVGSKLP